MEKGLLMQHRFFRTIQQGEDPFPQNLLSTSTNNLLPNLLPNLPPQVSQLPQLPQLPQLISSTQSHPLPTAPALNLLNQPMQPQYHTTSSLYGQQPMENLQFAPDSMQILPAGGGLFSDGSSGSSRTNKRISIPQCWLMASMDFYGQFYARSPELMQYISDLVRLTQSDEKKFFYVKDNVRDLKHIYSLGRTNAYYEIFGNAHRVPENLPPVFQPFLHHPDIPSTILEQFPPVLRPSQETLEIMKENIHRMNESHKRRNISSEMGIAIQQISDIWNEDLARLYFPGQFHPSLQASTPVQGTPQQQQLQQPSHDSALFKGGTQQQSPPTAKIPATENQDTELSTRMSSLEAAVSSIAHGYKRLLESNIFKDSKGSSSTHASSHSAPQSNHPQHLQSSTDSVDSQQRRSVDENSDHALYTRGDPKNGSLADDLIPRDNLNGLIRHSRKGDVEDRRPTLDAYDGNQTDTEQDQS